MTFYFDIYNRMVHVCTVRVFSVHVCMSEKEDQNKGKRCKR